ncbi:MAG TPA: YdcF family protein [Candidatus Caenarcaniphilales bacterium]
MRRRAKIFPLQDDPPLPRRVKSAKHKPLRSLAWSALFALTIGFAYGQWRGYSSSPEAVLVLGGALEREKFAADFARQHPDLPIWISGGSNPEYAEWLFAEAGIKPERVHLDYDAVDTVTNFTTTVDKLKAQGIKSIYLITSDYHMRRSRVIGEIVLGSRGIHLQPVPVPSQQPPESLEKALFDGTRALLWVTTGSTGSTLAQTLKSQKLQLLLSPTSPFKELLPHFLLELKHKAGQSKQ